MLLAPTAHETEIADSVAAALAKDAPLGIWLVPGADIDREEQRVTALAAGLGWLGLGLPEAVGGSGLSVVEEALVLREAGRALAPVTFLPSILAGHIALAAGDAEAASAFAGGCRLAGLRLAGDGETVLIAGGSAAGHAVAIDAVNIRCSTVSGNRVRAVPLDAASSLVVVRAADLELGHAAGASLVDRALVLVAAQQVGAAERTVSESADYARLREQFGRQIGSFQAVRHRCADMAVRAERAKAQLFFAAVSVRDGAGDARFQALAALQLAGDAAWQNAKANILNHGAIGVTAEHSAHLFLKRAMLWRNAVLAPHALLDALAAAPPPGL